MKKSFLFYILKVLTLPLILFPLQFHYFIWNGIAFIVHKVVGYRKETVQLNLKNSFPEKSTEELIAIEKSFYRRFVYTLLSSFYILNLSSKKHKKRCVFENHEVFSEQHKQNKNIILVGGHYGNWEFFKPSDEMTEKMYFAYKEQNNKLSDLFIKEIRKKRNVKPLEVTQTYRTLLNDFKNNKSFSYLFYADQRPIVGKDSKFWINFLNQPTDFITTAERLASKTNAAVIFFKMYEEKKGFFKVRLELLTPDASKEEKGIVTTRYVRALEQSIIERPDHWLWTHKKWKHQPTDKDLLSIH